MDTAPDPNNQNLPASDNADCVAFHAQHVAGMKAEPLDQQLGIEKIKVGDRVVSDALDTQHWLNAWREYRTHNTTSNPPSEIWKGTVDSNESGVVDESTDGADPTQPSATNTDWLTFQAQYAAATVGNPPTLAEQLGNLPLYAGYWWDDAIGLYHVRHRVYRPEWGRWLQRDPLGCAPGWNLYQYVNGMPWGSVDPMGLWGIGDLWDWITGDGGKSPKTAPIDDRPYRAPYNLSEGDDENDVVKKQLAVLGPGQNPIASGAAAGDYDNAYKRSINQANPGNEARVQIGEVTLEMHVQFATGMGPSVASSTGAAEIFAAGNAAKKASDAACAASKGVQPGQSGAFSSLKGTKGDGLSAHHMPQAAGKRTGYGEGGALVMTEAEHAATRTYGSKGASTVVEDAKLTMRQVLAEDLRDVRRIVGRKYNEGLKSLLNYYREVFPGLMEK